MKKIFFISISLFSSLFADIPFDTDCIQEEFQELEGPFPSLCNLPPYSFEAWYGNVKKAKFRTPDIEGEELKYSELDANFTYFYPFNSLNGISFGVGYVGSEVEWKENPYFSTDHFSYVTFTLAGTTQVVDNWVWKMGGALLLDTAELNFADYALYQYYLFGKYSVCQPLMFNVGLILELGLNKEKVWPVLGLDYYYSEKLNIHLVYPLDVSLEYFVIPTISLECAARFFRNRHRVKNNQPLPMGIFEYHTTGAEFDLNFYPTSFLLISGFVGKTFNGDLKITDRNNHNAIHNKFRGSLYAGVYASMSF